MVNFITKQVICPMLHLVGMRQEKKEPELRCVSNWALQQMGTIPAKVPAPYF